jgi:hypothetical protein
MAEPPVELKPNIDESGIAQITVLAEGKKIVLGCERGGEYKEMKTNSDVKFRSKIFLKKNTLDSKF